MAKRSREESDPAIHDEHQQSAPEPQALSSDPPSPTTSNAHESAKLVHLYREANTARSAGVMRCSLPPHRPDLLFSTFEEYEVHYSKAHVNRCVECRKNFPTSHFLNLHQAENHNPLVAILRDRGEHTYGCFVEGCERKCASPQKRRLHLIDKHMFPKDYDFFVVNDGIDRKTSMLRSGRHGRRSSITQHKVNSDTRDRQKSANLDKNISEEAPTGETAGETVHESPGQRAAVDGRANDPKEASMDVDGLAGAMSALRFVPSSVRFGRGRARAGFSKT